VIAAMNRHEIQVLRAAGMAQAVVAAKTAVSVRSVRRLEGEAEVTTADTTALIQARGVGRPGIAAAWATVVAAWFVKAGTRSDSACSGALGVRVHATVAVASCCQ